MLIPLKIPPVIAVIMKKYSSLMVIVGSLPFFEINFVAVMLPIIVKKRGVPMAHKPAGCLWILFLKLSKRREVASHLMGRKEIMK